MGSVHRMRTGNLIAETVRVMYGEGQTDYSLEPIVLVSPQGKPVGRIEDGDAVIFCCRRGEREVQLTEAFTESSFEHFPRPDYQQPDFIILTLYHEKFKDLPVAFAPSKVKDSLGEIVSRAGLRQMRVAESEKFAHVTFFFNGGHNQPFPGEVDVRIPSPKGLPFDQIPELSLAQVAEQVCQAIENRYDLIVTNFANGDVIGHTANREAKIQCAEIVDKQLGKVVQAARQAGYVTLITADHGNLEEMVHPDGTPHMAHTTNPAPFILVDLQANSFIQLRNGSLEDIAATILSIQGLEKPAAMTGRTLAPGHVWGKRRPALLIILDGWGIGRQDSSNPIYLAETPVWDDLTSTEPTSSLQAAGEAVGLKAGKAGNSEAGHMNIGAGRVILQDDVRLDQAMQDGSFYQNEILCGAIEAVRQRHSKLHLIGLLSEKSSHGSIDYPLAILKMARQAELQEVYLHMIFDGRSTQPGSAPSMLEALEERIDTIGVGQIVTGVGRGIALDRDGNYAKTRQAYEAMVWGIGRECVAHGTQPTHEGENQTR
jgi:2,3-bisphosphoglycerate-independent phosphoglycerate mutase